MKKITLLFTLLFTMLWSMSVAFADPEDWFDRNYKFSNISGVMVYAIDTSKTNLSHIQSKSLMDRYLDKSKEADVRIFTSDATAAVPGDKPLIQHYQLYVQASLQNYTSFYKHYDAYTAMESRTREEKWQDDQGHWVTRKVYYKEPVFHPAHDELCYTITMAYQVYDVKTGKTVWEREDTRTRETNDPKGMLNRSFNSFFEKLKDKIH